MRNFHLASRQQRRRGASRKVQSELEPPPAAADVHTQYLSPTFFRLPPNLTALIHLYSAELLEWRSDKAMKGESERRLDLEEAVGGGRGAGWGEVRQYHNDESESSPSCS